MRDPSYIRNPGTNLVPPPGAGPVLVHSNAPPRLPLTLNPSNLLYL